MGLQNKQPVRLPAPFIFLVVHLAVLSLTWALASQVSQRHPELSAPGVHIRLVPVDVATKL